MLLPVVFVCKLEPSDPIPPSDRDRAAPASALETAAVKPSEKLVLFVIASPGSDGNSEAIRVEENKSLSQDPYPGSCKHLRILCTRLYNFLSIAVALAVAAQTYFKFGQRQSQG